MEWALNSDLSIASGVLTDACRMVVPMKGGLEYGPPRLFNPYHRDPPKVPLIFGNPERGSLISGLGGRSWEWVAVFKGPYALGGPPTL